MDRGDGSNPRVKRVKRDVGLFEMELSLLMSMWRNKLDFERLVTVLRSMLDDENADENLKNFTGALLERAEKNLRKATVSYKEQLECFVTHY